MTRIFTILFSAILLAACTLAPAPKPDEPISRLGWFAYKDSQGHISSYPTAVDETRTQAWQRWLRQHHGAWRRGIQPPVNGWIRWCALWQEAQRARQICRRGNTLIYLPYGELRDETAIQAAQQILGIVAD